jgi:putative NADH-flavin reductase
VPYIEVTRKIVLAMKALKTPYLITVGGTGSLSIPGKPYLTALDSEDFWTAYFQHAADSVAYRAYAEERFPKFALLLQRYHDIREFHERDEEDMQFMREMTTFTKSRTTESHFIMACRASLLFYQGNKDFNWTFLSPSPGFKPGPKTGKYEIGAEAMLPIDGSPTPPWEGRLLGITVKDLAAVIADEAETKKMPGKHWTVYTPREFATDEPLKSVYGSLAELDSA